MTDSEIQHILESLIESINPAGREPNVFTTSEFMTQAKWNRERALRALKASVAAGRVEPSMIRVTNDWGIDQHVKGWRIIQSGSVAK